MQLRSIGIEKNMDALKKNPEKKCLSENFFPAFFANVLRSKIFF